MTTTTNTIEPPPPAPLPSLSLPLIPNQRLDPPPSEPPPPSPLEPRITDIKVVLEPKVGTIFDSENEARECCATHAKAKSFEAVTKTSRKREDGVKAYITYGCHRSRKPRTTALDPIKSQPTTKVDCKAAMNISLQVDGKWKLNSIELNHNHELDPDNVRS